MLTKGCIRYLATIVDTMERVIIELLDVHVVCKFPDMFLEELLGLPSDQEIEFEIELLPRTTSISKGPYQMALVELKELKQ